jgi:hypothetical protein
VNDGPLPGATIPIPPDPKERPDMGSISFGLTVYRCTPEYAEVFLDIISDYDLTPSQPRKRGKKLLHLGVTYVPRSDGPSSGVAHDVIARFAKIDHAAVSWEVYQGVDEDGYLGDMFRHTPELGDWRGSCDDSGDPLVEINAVRTAREKFGDGPQFAEAILRAAGEPWAAEFASYGLTKDSHVEPPQLVDILWDRKTGTVEIDGTDYPGGPVLYSTSATMADEAEEMLRGWLERNGWTLHTSTAYRNVRTLGRAGRIWEGEVYRTSTAPAAGGAK